MNYCNFAKVLIARASKDLNAIKWWNEEENRQKLDTKPVLSENMPIKNRYEYFIKFIEGYKKMHIGLPNFTSMQTRLQSYLTNKKHWLYGNKKGEKKQFLEHFSLQTWASISHEEKKQHTIENCIPCNTVHIQISKLHSSSKSISKEIHQTCETATETFITMTKLSSPPSSGSKQKGIKLMKSMINAVQPIMEEKLKVKFDHQLAASVAISPPINPKTHQQEINKTITNSRNQMESMLSSNGNDISNFLASGKSYNQYNRDRLDTYYEENSTATKRVEKQINRELSGLKQGKHHAQFSKYVFDQELFINEMKDMPQDSNINWSDMARKYKIRCNGKFPLNGGQILLEYAKHRGIDISTFNKTKRVSSRDYLRRIRRAKKTVTINKRKVTMPTPRPLKSLKQAVIHQVTTEQIYIGKQVAPKTTTITRLDKSGELVEKEKKIYGRKIPLDHLRKESLKEQKHLGIIRLHTDTEYSSMEMGEVHARLDRINEETPENLTEAINKLKQLERTRSIKVWHDHSEILNHSYVCFMLSWVYDKANFLTDGEYQEQFPQLKPVCVQALVERPMMYIFGKSGSSDTDQVTYINTRREDLRDITSPVITEVNGEDIEIRDVIRFFSGDGPARQFEAGQQRGGNFSCLCGVNVKDHTNFVHCLQTDLLSLDDRCKLAISENSIKELKAGNLHPFQNMNKKNLQNELESRGIYNNPSTSKSDLLEELQSTLHGISRPPALLLTEPTTSTKDINIPNYEVLPCEPLHDLSNIIKNLITELPFHTGNTSVQKELEAFAASTVGERGQIKGSDARLYLVQLAKYAQNLHTDKKVDDNFLQLIKALVDITSICYSSTETRNPKQILRLHNQCFIFSIMCRIVIGNPVKMTNRKFFGSHFHCLTTHAPQILRVFNLRSIVTEQEERCFGDLRRISENTSNRQSEYVVDNAVLRFVSQHSHQRLNSKPNAFHLQNSVISKQASLLQPSSKSSFSSDFISKRQTLFQAHLERISDYMMAGENIWWSWQNGQVVFNDGQEDPCWRPEGPTIHNFRSTSLPDEKKYIREKWDEVLHKFETSQLVLPIKKIKVFDNDGNPSYVTRKTGIRDNGTMPVEVVEEVDIIIEEKTTATDAPKEGLTHILNTKDGNSERDNIMDLSARAANDEAVQGLAELAPVRRTDTNDIMDLSARAANDEAVQGLAELAPVRQTDTNDIMDLSARAANDEAVQGLAELAPVRQTDTNDLLQQSYTKMKDGTYNENEDIKNMYHSHMKVLKWLQNGETDKAERTVGLNAKDSVHENSIKDFDNASQKLKKKSLYENLTKDMNDGTQNLKRKSLQDDVDRQGNQSRSKGAKRRLFLRNIDTEEIHDSESDMACPFKTDDPEEDPEESVEEKEERIPTSNLITMILGETVDVATFLKYRRLANNMPSFMPRYQSAKAIIETRLLKKHSDLKKKTQNNNVKHQTQMVESVMDRWGTYYKY